MPLFLSVFQVQCKNGLTYPLNQFEVLTRNMTVCRLLQSWRYFLFC